MMDRWFDMMNTSYYYSQRRGKSDMKPFEANDCFSNKRLIWLKIFLYLTLKHGIKVLFYSYEALTEAERRAMLLSKATSNGLLMTNKAMVHLIEVCFGNGAKFVVIRRINQEPLESNFGQQRQRGWRCDAPTVSMFAYNVRSVNCLRSGVRRG